MKLRLPHNFLAALMAALASVSFTTLSTASLGAAFFLGHQTFAEDAAEEPAPSEAGDETSEFDIGYADPDTAPEESDKQQQIEIDQANIKANEVGSNGGAGNNDGLLLNEDEYNDIDETALDAVAGSGQQDTVSGTADATPAENLDFTSNPFGTGTESSNGSDSVFTETAAPAAAVAATESLQQTTMESTSTGTTSSGTGTSSYGTAPTAGSAGGGNVAQAPMRFAMFNLGSSTSSLSLGSASSSNDLAPSATLGDAGDSSGQQAQAAEMQGSETWDVPRTDTTVSGNVLSLTKISCDKNQMDKGAVKQNSVFAPDVNVGNGTGTWTLTFTIHNNAEYAVTLKDLLLDVSMFNSEGAPQTAAVNRSVVFTLKQAANELGKVDTVMQGRGDVTQASYIFDGQSLTENKPVLTFGEGVALGKGASIEFTLTTAQGSNISYRGGCYFGLLDMVASYTYQASECVWSGTEGQTWGDVGAWTGGVPTSSTHAVFNGSGASAVNITSPAEAAIVTVSGQDYTFTLSGDSASLSTGAIQIASGSSLTVSGGAVTTGTLTISDGATLTVGGTGSMTLNSLSGSGTLVKNDGSTVTIKQAATNYTGAITVNAGILVAAVDHSLGNGTVTVGENGTLELKADGGMPSITGTGTVKVTDGDFQYHDKDFLEQFRGTVDIANGGIAQLGQASSKFANATLKVSSGGTLKGWSTTFNHDILLNGGTLSHANNNMTYNGNISLLADSFVDGQNSNQNKTKLQGTINGNHKLTSTGGKVQIESSGVIGALETNASETIINGTGLTVGSLTGTNDLTINQGMQLTVDTAAADTYSGTIGGDGTLVKRGSGTLTLEAANTCKTLNVYEGAVELGNGGAWTGAANVYDGGTLRITSAGTNQTGSVTVNQGGILDLATNGTVGNDTAVFTVNGGTITGSGTLDITTLNVGANGAVVFGTVSLGTENDPMGTLHLENTLISKGDNGVYANAVTFVGDLGESVGAGSTFKDTVSDSGNEGNGYVVTAKVVIVENAEGALTSNLGDGKHTITHDGWTYTLQQDADSNIYISLMASTERAMQGDYYINTGDVTYGDSGNATGQERTNTLFVNGGNLVFKDTDLKTGVNLHVHKDGMVTLGAGRTLNEGLVHVKAGATMTLNGSGTYVLSPATQGARGTLPAGTVLKGGADGFTGTVQVSKDSVLNGTDLSGLVNGNHSRVAFNGATGSLTTGEIAQNIHLVDFGSQAALSLNTGTSGDTRQFTGAITGTGTLARSYVNGSGNIGGEQNYVFSGNLSGWTGVFDNQVEGAANTTNLTFSGGATEVNAEIKNGVAGSTGPLNVITTGSDGTEFNRSVTATSFTANGANASFNAALRLTGDATAEEDAKLIINNSASVGGSLSGDVLVTKAGNLTVGGTATLDNLTDNGMASFNNIVSASGAVTVGDGASLYLNNSGIDLGNGASLTINSGSMVGLSGWTETQGDPTKSGVVKTGFTGGQLFSGNGTNVTVQTGSYFMKDGAKFLYSGTGGVGNRVTVHTDGDKAGTVDIINAIYYNVHTGDSKSMGDVKDAAEAEHAALDYIHIQSGGTLTGVTDANKGTYGIGDSGLQGSGTIAVGENGQLTDDVSLMSFGGSITVGSGSTLVTDGSNTRTVSVNGGTYKATDNITLGSNVTFSGSGNDMPTIEVGEGNTVTVLKQQGEATRQTDLHKTGGGTLHLTDTSTSGSRTAVITGNMVIDGGTVVLTVHRHSSDGCGIVDGNITMASGTDLVMEGFDALGNKDQGTKAKQITMAAGTEDNLTTLAFTRNGSDPETLQHTTLSTDIVMAGNTEMSGLRLNAYGTHNESDLGGGAYIHASGMNNTITNTFAMRENAYFEVDADSELTLLGNMELFDSGAESKKVIKTGYGVLDFAGENSTLHAIDIQNGLVEVTGNLTFNGPNKDQFLMALGTQFTVQNGATFNYRGWLFENNDGTQAPGTVTAAARSSTYILADSNLVVSGMKLTNNNSGDQVISARLDNVQLVNQGYNVTINNATGEGTTQRIASLTAKSGVTTLHSATLDAASVNPGATLTFSASETVELGSTILNGGTVNLAGTINVSDLAGFTPQAGGGYADADIHEGKVDPGYNGFYQGGKYYLIQEEATGSTVTGADPEAPALTLTYQGGQATFGKEDNTNSYWFRVTQPSTLYYINGNDGEAEETTYKNWGTPEYNRMYAGLDATESHVALATTGIVLNYNGAVLTLAQDLRYEVRTITAGSAGIVANYNGTVDIQKDVTLHQSDLSGREGAVVSLVGKGLFDLDGTTLKDVSGGLTQGGEVNWNGTVRASGTADNMIGTMMGNIDSTLLFNGVKGSLTNADTQYVMKVELQNGGGDGANATKALDNTFSTGANRTFTNTVSGSGDIRMTGEASGSTQSIAFTGDVSGWVGTEQDAATFETATQGTTNLKFSGGATEINVVIEEGEGSTINLSAGPTVAAEGETQVFNGDITASSLTVEAGADTTLNNITAISGLVDVTAANAQLHVAGTTTAQTVQVAAGSSISVQSGTETLQDTAFITSNIENGEAVLDGGIQLQKEDDMAIIKSSTEGNLATVSHANISLSVAETPEVVQSQASTPELLAVSGTDEGDLPLLTGNTLADAIAGSTLKLENLVLSADSHVSGATGNATAGNVLIGGTVEQVMGDENTGTGQSGTLSATSLTLTGTTDQTSEPVGNRLYSLDFTGMDTMASLSGASATLLLDFTQMYTLETWADMIRDIDYLGVNFKEGITELNVGALQVQARGYDANGNVATYIGYYVNTGESNNGAAVGQVIYFEVPEPTTSTLSLLALMALAARRRRK